MRKLITLLLLLFGLALPAQDLPNDLYGVWYNMEGETLIIDKPGSFIRTKGIEVLSTGYITLREDGKLYIVRMDKEIEYSLSWGVQPTTLVVTKPPNEDLTGGQAWLFYRIK
tara:strand:+ start:55 stop:390 length:336 start_codon:yes stop_codon:yes gene_type:complete